jgi:hypothetical protein
LIIIKLQALIHRRTQVMVPVDKLWEMLGELYDLEVLDEMVRRSMPILDKSLWPSDLSSKALSPAIAKKLSSYCRCAEGSRSLLQAPSSSVSLPSTPEKLSPVIKATTKKKQVPAANAGSGSELSDVSSSPSPPPTSKRPTGRKGAATHASGSATVSKSAAVIDSKHFKKTFELPGISTKMESDAEDDDEARGADGEVFRSMALSRAEEEGRDEDWEGPAEGDVVDGRDKGGKGSGEAEGKRGKGTKRAARGKQREDPDEDDGDDDEAGARDEDDEEQAEEGENEEEDDEEDEKPTKKNAKTYSRQTQNARTSTRRSTRDKKARSSSLSGDDEAEENEDEDGGEDETATGGGSDGEDESEDDKEETPEEEEPKRKRRGRPPGGKRKRDSGEGGSAATGTAATTRGRARTATVEKEESEEETHTVCECSSGHSVGD